jgi:predicted methyltransferase
MRFSYVAAISLTLVAAPLAAKGAPQPPANVAAAVAATSGRTPDNVKLDESRKPAEVLQFLGLRQGMQVLDLFGSNRYWAEIMAPAVGPGGHVTVWQPATKFFTDERRKAFDDFAARQKNVSLIAGPWGAPELPKSAFDFAILNLDYHDLYWEKADAGITRTDPNAFVKAVYAAMKPGGVIGVIDHVANPGGDTRATVEKLHRIDPDVIKADFQRAGFVLDGTSDLLRNPADDHSLLVFDPNIRGKTDRVVVKFKKPR